MGLILHKPKVPTAEAQQAHADRAAKLGAELADIGGGGLDDAVAWRNLIPLNPQAVAGYDDGLYSTWPQDAWDYWAAHNVPAAHITCLARAASLVFDFEDGNAPIGQVAAAIKIRYALRLPSVVYTDRAKIAEVTAALAAAGLALLGRDRWPVAGVYLWAADWTGSPHDPGWAPAPPIAVQYASVGPFDASTTFSTFPLTTPGGSPVTTLDQDDLNQISTVVHAAAGQELAKFFAPGSASQPQGEGFGRFIQAWLQAMSEDEGKLLKDFGTAFGAAVNPVIQLTDAQVATLGKLDIAGQIALLNRLGDALAALTAST